MTLKEKYQPIFEQLEQIMRQKKMEYLDYMTTNLEKNHDKTLLEQETLIKLEKSFNQLKPHFRTQLQKYKENIEHNVKVQTYKSKKEQAEKEGKTEGVPEPPEDLELREVDSDKIKSIVSLIDEFNNIIGKNYSVYG